MAKIKNIIFILKTSIILQVDLNTMTNIQCTNPPVLWTRSQISDNMICAASPGKASCQGDSGGALVTNEGKYYSVIGRNNNK